MKRKLSLTLVLAALIFSVIVAPVSAQYEDGTYQVNYEVKHESNNNASIADGYFTKPATVTIENGVQTVKLTITGSNYVKALSGPSGPVTVLSEDDANHTRTVQFQVNGDLSNPIMMSMDIVVPDLYDTTHKARLVLDTSSITKAGASSGGNDDANTTADSGEQVENPKTGEDSSIALYAGLMVAAIIGLVAARKFRPARD